MTISSIAKYLAAWFVMLLVSIANGAVRDFTYGKLMSELSAHQLSTLTSVLLLGAIIFAFVHFFPPSSDLEAVCIGLLWMSLTIAFEFLFFHFVGGHSWAKLLANYNILEGRVWVVVLAWVAVAPYVFFRLRRPT
ncbi:hypothetical protein [Desulfuromonas sp. DDH964]|uniref:hypothetical protein n=1 Tax=Desulfuromonas sp. DDH964 TaxID=1823759 RepID=UPI0008306355|nr:hypothetical protein [Desulfuromonas sp. DDH964]